MDRDSKRADAAHTMTTLLRYQQRAGRFGRELRGEEVETYDDRDEPVTLGYVVDADAVAAAIADRLLAGRALVLKAPPGPGA
jgi:ATP-dependent helicase YprA (DUF1998 family)